MNTWEKYQRLRTDNQALVGDFRHAESARDAALVRAETAEGAVTILRDAAAQAVLAIHFTREYVGLDLLPQLEGWSHHDATVALNAALTATTPEGEANG